MIEVPAAALLADRILEHVDFLSIGTNDLAQYTMAADRMSADLATLTDPWQPAVLALVAMAVRAGAAVGKPVGVCGEAAADPTAGVRAHRPRRDVAVRGGSGGQRRRRQAGAGDAAAVPRRGRRRADHGERGRRARRRAGSAGLIAPRNGDQRLQRQKFASTLAIRNATTPSPGRLS